MPKPWNVEVRVSGSSHKEKETIRSSFEEAPFPQTTIDRQLEPTPFEKTAIIRVNEALQDMFKKLDLPPHVVSADRVHILSPEYFRTVQRNTETEGFTNHGHVFIQRRHDPVEFYQELTHELVHAASYYVLAVCKEGERRLAVSNRRMGLGFMPEGASHIWVEFGGLNEGITELIAYHLRRLLAETSTGLDRKQIQTLTREIYYARWVNVASRVTDIIALAEGISSNAVLRSLFQDYVSGSYQILRRLELARPGSVKALMPLKRTDTDARKAAKALGLWDLAGDKGGDRAA